MFQLMTTSDSYEISFIKHVADRQPAMRRSHQDAVQELASVDAECAVAAVAETQAREQFVEGPMFLSISSVRRTRRACAAELS